MNFEELEQIADSVRVENQKFDHEINVCMGTGCLSQHSDQLKDALAESVEKHGKRCLVRRTGCMGLCAAGPLVLVDPEEVLYQHVKAENADTIAASLGASLSRSSNAICASTSTSRCTSCSRTPGTSIRKRLTTI
jgi:bidirectional [NiFe] hydrogenase diaphorase subunit